jgi:hypothetical protein
VQDFVLRTSVIHDWPVRRTVSVGDAALRAGDDD